MWESRRKARASNDTPSNIVLGSVEEIACRTNSDARNALCEAFLSFTKKYHNAERDEQILYGLKTGFES